MQRFHFRRVTDGVHGTFGISEIESDIISAPVFQRLHNVRQLGLAHLVYPGADYSRFSHSLGACHIAGRMMRAINQNLNARRWNDDDIQMYRLAGLLHDLGHYPFSHAMEHVVENHYKEAAFLADRDQIPPQENADKSEEVETSEDPESPAAYLHEPLGREVITRVTCSP